jgi:hypothetical protein
MQKMSLAKIAFRCVFPALCLASILLSSCSGLSEKKPATLDELISQIASSTPGALEKYHNPRSGDRIDPQWRGRLEPGFWPGR